MHRFYFPELSAASELSLNKEESHHALHVLRLKAGDKIVVFNGQGLEATAEITSETTKKQVFFRILHQTQTTPLACKITLAQAVPKGKNMDLIIQKATELGASAIVPLLSERVVTRLEDQEDAQQKQNKWQSIAIEAAKQCGQNWLPKVGLPQTLKEFFAHKTSYDLMVIGSLQKDAKHLRTWLTEFQNQHSGQKPKNALVLVGPEGDFTPAEIALAKSESCLPITLGPIILRTETAAIYCLSVLAYELF